MMRAINGAGAVRFCIMGSLSAINSPIASTENTATAVVDPMLLLAVYLIIDGLLGFGLNLGPAIFLLYIVALASGVFILIGK